MLQVDSEAASEQVYVSAELKPFAGVMVIDAVPVAPCVTEIVATLAARVKL
jgi:hypothetical protein